ncbi:putative transmembrane protein [Trifolium repens]|nr:putative transmembrane protein [Trifolium repens]
MKWVDEINEEIKNNGPSIDDEKEQWRKHSIYKIPSRITDLNKKAYKPQAISFGPYYYGEENLEAMEEHKHRALVRFLKRCQKPVELLFQRLDQVVQELIDSYKPLDSIWTNDTQKFLQMMILDGCFILEILRVNDPEILVNEYDENDFVFGKHGKLHVMPYVSLDMLLLENQIPIKVLHILSEVAEEDDHELLYKKILNVLNPSTPLIGRLGKCMHILDVFRKSLIQQSLRTPRMRKATKRNWLTLEAGEEMIRSAVELHEAGIRFKKNSTWSLKNVSFDRGVLRLPTLVIDDTTEYMLHNLIALERLHVGAGNEVTSFVIFMGSIIQSSMDVAFLNREGILFNALESDKDVSKLFKSLSKYLAVDHNNGYLKKVATDISPSPSKSSILPVTPRTHHLL